MNPDLVFVTGATGFVGSHFLKRLDRTGYRTAALYRNEPPQPNDRIPHPENIEWVRADAIEEWIRVNRPRVVVHFATDYGRSTRPSACLASNLCMPLRLLEAAEQAGVELFLNTDTFFGKPAFNYGHLRDYHQSKALFLEWAQNYTSSRQIRFLTLRLEHVYGEHDGAQKFTPWLVAHLLGDVASIALTSGEQRRDFVHVADVAEAFLTVMNAHYQIPVEVRELEVGTGVAVSLREFATLAHRLSGSSARLLFGELPQRDNEISCSTADTRAMKALGWLPTLALEDGLDRTLRSFLDRHA